MPTSMVVDRLDSLQNGFVDARTIAKLCDVQSETVLDWFKQGRIPGRRVTARCIRFRWHDVQKALDRFEIKEVR